MSDLFQRLSVYDKVPTAHLAAHVPYDPSTAPHGVWPTEYGSPAQTSVAGEPLTADRWVVAWKAPLDPDGMFTDVVVGAGTVIVNGNEQRAVFGTDGRAIGKMRRHMGACFLDSKGGRLLGQGTSGGITVYTVRDGKRESLMMLAFPGYRAATIFSGPDALVVLSLADLPQTRAPEAVVEVVRISDYGNKSKNGFLRGIEQVAGIIRNEDARVCMAASRTGPVLATPDGIHWCDWRLSKLHEVRGAYEPNALSADVKGRAFLAYERAGEARFTVLPPGGVAAYDVKLPWRPAMQTPPPIVTQGGSVIFTPPGRLFVLTPDGHLSRDEARASRAPASMASNGIVLLPTAALMGMTPDGQRHVLWQPPSELVTAPVLAGGHIYVATEHELYALRPA